MFGRVPLSDGDLLEVGHTVLLYRPAVATPLLAGADVDSIAFEGAWRRVDLQRLHGLRIVLVA